MTFEDITTSLGLAISNGTITIEAAVKGTLK